jgi:hypothetical protein
MRLRRNQVCPNPSFLFVSWEGSGTENKAPLDNLAFAELRIHVTRGVTGNSAPTGRCESCSIKRSFPREENAASAVRSSRITAMSYRTISIHGKWAGHGETITQTIFRLLTGGATGKRDQAEFNALEEDYLRKPA